MSHSAIFVDRPSLITPETVERGQPNMHINQSALRGLLDLRAGTYQLVFIGNDDAIAYERVPEKKQQRLCAIVADTLARAGIHILADYTCPWAPDAQPNRRKDSVFRLPNVGAFKAARLEYDIHLETSWVISDRAAAMLAGSRSGARTALVRSPRNEKRYDITPDLVADDTGAAIRFLRKLHVAMTR